MLRRRRHKDSSADRRRMACRNRRTARRLTLLKVEQAKRARRALDIPDRCSRRGRVTERLQAGVLEA